MNEIIREIEAAQLKAEVPAFETGDTVRVYGKIKEGNRERIQVFEGVVLKKQGGSNRETFDYTLSGNTHIRLPWDVELSTDLSWRIREGYSGNAGRDELLWNAQISKRFLKKKQAMVRLRMFDILQQQNNQTRSVSANGITDTTSNLLTSYCILNFTYRFNTLGGRGGRHR